MSMRWMKAGPDALPEGVGATGFPESEPQDTSISPSKADAMIPLYRN
jgi:hypothetical protein